MATPSAFKQYQRWMNTFGDMTPKKKTILVGLLGHEVLIVSQPFRSKPAVKITWQDVVAKNRKPLSRFLTGWNFEHQRKPQITNLFTKKGPKRTQTYKNCSLSYSSPKEKQTNNLTTRAHAKDCDSSCASRSWRKLMMTLAQGKTCSSSAKSWSFSSKPHMESLGGKENMGEKVGRHPEKILQEFFGLKEPKKMIQRLI